MTQPTLQVTGYRGVWGESLTADIAAKYARAFGQFIKSKNNADRNPTILIGRDGRESGRIIANAIIPVIENLGINVIDGDILPTPTIMFAVNKYNYDGAVIITASHNPIEYNGIKFVVKGGRLTNEEERDQIIKYIDERGGAVAEGLLGATATKLSEFSPENSSALSNSIPSEDKIPNFAKEHADHILKYINVEAIRARKFRVAVDMINASACVVDPYLFEQLGVELIPLNNIPNGQFAHKPEPTIENLVETGKLVKESGADIGFAHDPDADRMVIINEHGVVISEEYTLGFGAELILSKNPGRAVVINMSTSQLIPDIADKYGSKCIRTKVGEANVMAGMIEHNAIVGGEGTSGVIFPTLNNCRDSFVSLTLALQLLAERNQTVNECVNSLPMYFMKRGKWPVSGDLESMYTKLKNHFKDGKINEIDGLRIDMPDQSWIHIRRSITEPIVRLFTESKSQEHAEEIFAEATEVIS